jgi:hypothetical protein
VRVLKKSCFEKSQIETIVFEGESQLKRIEESCFSAARLRSIVIPKSVEVLENSCFAHATGSEFACEEGSRLMRVEEFCFHYSRFEWIRLPERTGLVAESAFEGSVFVQRQKRHRSKRFLTIMLRITCVLITVVLIALGALVKVAFFREPWNREEPPPDLL